MLLIFIKNQNEKVMKVFMINNLTMFEGARLSFNNLTKSLETLKLYENPRRQKIRDKLRYFYYIRT
jgi:hypothetical protein